MAIENALSMVMMGVIFTIFIILFVFIPFVTLQSKLVATVVYENNYNSALLGLRIFLSSTVTSGGETRTVSDILATHIAFNDPSDITFLKSKLDALFKCYELQNEKGILLKAEDCTPSQAEAKSEIVLPVAGKSILTLVIN